ncbi:MAG TPA: 5'-3' exonuclease H3TH domain-containing protein [Verrucomicrobiae bacterium]|nr:5'-3' exonuclease H3TH domain-containing protein [Verrucomicrobiae bacterium]
MTRLLIIDGHAFAYRAFHAIRELQSPSGEPTNAIFGFIKMVARMRTVIHPTHLVVVWDGGLNADRLAALPEYKANRPGMPADLEVQIDGIVEYLAAAGVASYCQDGVEADDYIASLARHALAADMDVVIASSDKDFMQLVQPGVGLLNPNDKTESVWAADRVHEKTGVDPEQIVDWLSLIGDHVDNVAGVPGVGPKTATELLKQFGSVDALYRRLAEVKSERVRNSLQAAEPAVRRNQSVIRLKDDLPCEFSPGTFAERSPDTGTLRALFQGWGFRTLLNELNTVEMGQGALI